MKNRTNRWETSYGLVQLLEGNKSQINPESSLDGQVELLPYDFKWEFPEESLVLGITQALKVNNFLKVICLVDQYFRTTNRLWTLRSSGEGSSEGDNNADIDRG